MAPGTRRVQETQVSNDIADDGGCAELFLDPMLGTPLALYIEKDVEDRDQLVELITVSHINHMLETLENMEDALENK